MGLKFLETALRQKVSLGDLRRWDETRDAAIEERLRAVGEAAWPARFPESGVRLPIRDAVQNILDAVARERQAAILQAAGHAYAPAAQGRLILPGVHCQDGLAVLIFEEGFRGRGKGHLTREYLGQLAHALRHSKLRRLWVLAPASAIPFVGDYYEVELAEDGADAGGVFRFDFESLPQQAAERLLARWEEEEAKAPAGGYALTADGQITLRMPGLAWDVLLERLGLDVASDWLDPVVREEIAAALGQIEVCRDAAGVACG